MYIPYYSELRIKDGVVKFTGSHTFIAKDDEHFGVSVRVGLSPDLKMEQMR